MWKTIDIADYQRVLMYRHNRLQAVLMPGRHRVSRLRGNVRLETYDITDFEFSAAQANFLLKQYGELLAPHLTRCDVADHQVALVYRDGHLVDLVLPGQFKAYWHGLDQVDIRVVDATADMAVEPALLGVLGRGLPLSLQRKLAAVMCYTEVPNEHCGMLMVNGSFVRELTSGRYGFWTVQRQVEVKHIDLRLQTMEVGGQEILTKDRVSLRLNLSATYRIANAQQVLFKLHDFRNFVYLRFQLALRESVGAQTLDALLENKDSLNTEVFQRVDRLLGEYGITLHGVGVKDIILPGDMKVILNQVVEAQKAAEANLIKRREETQAMRSLHNTAKLMDGNPVLLRLKELEALERVTERVNQLTVFGGLDGVLNGLVRLRPDAQV